MLLTLIPFFALRHGAGLFFWPTKPNMRVLAWDVGLLTLSYCVVDREGTTKTCDSITIRAWETIAVVRATGTLSPTEEAEAAIQCVHNRWDTLMAWTPDAVVIEAQPSGTWSNPRMKNVASALHAYFYTRFLTTNTPIPIRSVSATTKLIGFVNTETPEDAAARRAGDRSAMARKYKANKKHTVELTTQVLAQLDPTNPLTTTAHATWTAAAAKPDDLADALLLGLAYAQRNAPRPPRAKRKRAAAPA